MPRSAPSVSWATRQPAFSGPTRFDSSMTTSVRKISQVRFTVGVLDGPHLYSRRSHVHQEVGDAPALGCVGIGSNEQEAPVGPRRPTRPELLAVDVVMAFPAGPRPETGQIRSGLGFENPWLQISPSRMAGRWRCRGSSVPAASSVEAAWRIPMKASTNLGASWAASSENKTICRATGIPPPHSSGQCGVAKPASRNSSNQAFWKATNSISDTPVCAARHPRGTCWTHHSLTSARKLSSSASDVGRAAGELAGGPAIAE